MTTFTRRNVLSAAGARAMTALPFGLSVRAGYPASWKAGRRNDAGAGGNYPFASRARVEKDGNGYRYIPVQ